MDHIQGHDWLGHFHCLRGKNLFPERNVVDGSYQIKVIKNYGTNETPTDFPSSMTVSITCWTSRLQTHS